MQCAFPRTPDQLLQAAAREVNGWAEKLELELEQLGLLAAQYFHSFSFQFKY